MRILVTLSAHFTASGGEVFSSKLDYDGFWTRYLRVFEEVAVAARVRRVAVPPEGMARATGPGVRFIELPDYRGPWGYLNVRRRLLRALKAAIMPGQAVVLRVPDAIGTLTWRLLRPLAAPYGVEVVGDPWDSLAPGTVTGPLRPFIRRRARRDLRAQCAGAATAAYVTAEALQRRYRPAPGAYTTNYSSVDLPDDMVLHDAAPRLARTATIPRRLAGDGEPVRLGFIGSFSAAYKAPDVHIRAAAACIGAGANVVLEMAGDGAALGEMKALARELGVADRVIFRGRLPGGRPVFEFLDGVDLFLNASRQEGLPRALIEASARGCPAIGSDVAGIPEILDAPYLVPPGDAEALAERIRAVAADADALRRGALNAVKKAKAYRRSVLNERRTAHYRELARRTEQHWRRDPGAP